MVESFFRLRYLKMIFLEVSLIVLFDFKLLMRRDLLFWSTLHSCKRCSIDPMDPLLHRVHIGEPPETKCEESLSYLYRPERNLAWITALDTS